MSSIADQKKQKEYLKFLKNFVKDIQKNPEKAQKLLMNKAKEWLDKEYENEDLDKWVFTRVDMEEAFKAGQRCITESTKEIKHSDEI